jgi:hypothetical protein
MLLSSILAILALAKSHDVAAVATPLTHEKGTDMAPVAIEKIEVNHADKHHRHSSSSSDTSSWISTSDQDIAWSDDATSTDDDSSYDSSSSSSSRDSSADSSSSHGHHHHRDHCNFPPRQLTLCCNLYFYIESCPDCDLTLFCSDPYKCHRCDNCRKLPIHDKDLNHNRPCPHRAL